MDPRFTKVFCRPDFIPRLLAGDPSAWFFVILAGGSAGVALVEKLMKKK